MVQQKKSLQWAALATMLVAVIALGVRSARRATVSSDLRVEYGPLGLQRLTYQGTVLEDLAQSPSDGFHIWHMKMTGPDGKLRTDGQYGWGENNSARRWDNVNHAWTYRFTWGSIAVRFLQAGDRLDMVVTERNDPGSGVTLDGAAIYPLALHFPHDPPAFGEAKPQLAFNRDGPGVMMADYGTGAVATVVPDAARPLYSGFLPAGQPRTYTPIVSGTALDQLAASEPHFDRPVAPGETDTFTVSLRFAPSGADVSTVAGDVYAAWAKRWPGQLDWPDRRMIGTIYLATSPRSADGIRPSGFTNNPRRYFNEGDGAVFDIQSAAGLGRFQQRVLRQATDSVENLRRLHAQGAITWDLEGEQFAQPASYVCAPDQIARIAPEMESTISDPGSPYTGMKLDDAFFKMLRDSGFRVGVCVRPQRFAITAGTARQIYLEDADVAAELIRKMKYAHDRWGATLFYLDSTVDKDGGALDAAILQTAAAAMPDSLLIPEESTARDYAYTAPFQSFLFHGDLGTVPAIRRLYPAAFSVNLVNDVAPDTLAAARDTLTESVRRGDILMTHADYRQANNAVLVEMYRDAGRTP